MLKLKIKLPKKKKTLGKKTLHLDITLYSCIHDGHLSCFYFMAIVINATVNIHVQVFVWP